MSYCRDGPLLSEGSTSSKLRNGWLRKGIRVSEAHTPITNFKLIIICYVFADFYFSGIQIYRDGESNL